MSENFLIFSDNRDSKVSVCFQEEDMEDGYMLDVMCKNGSKKFRKNYKNMIWECWIEVNVWERI